MKKIKLFLKWVLNTHLKPTGITWYIQPGEHPDDCQCSGKCLRRKMSRDAAMNNWAMMKKQIRFYKCKVCGQGLYAWKKRNTCKRFYCYRNYDPRRVIKGTTVQRTSSKS